MLNEGRLFLLAGIPSLHITKYVTVRERRGDQLGRYHKWQQQFRSIGGNLSDRRAAIRRTPCWLGLMTDKNIKEEDNSGEDSPRKPYEKPEFRYERAFETMALSCGKMRGTQGLCRFNRKNS